MIRVDFSTLNFQDPLARESILMGGGKPLEYLRNKWRGKPLERHLPQNSFYLAPEDSCNLGKVEDFIDLVHSSGYPKIVRACLPASGDYCGDFWGAVDVFDTIRGVTDELMLRRAMQCTFLDAQSQEVREFIEWESGKPFCGKIGLLVQDDYGGDVGSLVEHPSEDNVFIVEKVIRRGLGAKDFIGQAVYENGKSIVDNTVQMEAKRYEIREAIDIYKAIKDSGLIPEGYSFQLEEGSDRVGQVHIYQVRLFRKKEKRADFEIHEIDGYEIMDGNDALVFTGPYHSFGITSKEGIELPITYLNPSGIRNFANHKQAAYYYKDDDNTHRSPDLSIRPDNLTLFWAGHRTCFLQHGFYRFGVKSDLLLVDEGTRLPLWNEDDYSGETKVRIFSNGVKGAIKYLGDVVAAGD